MLYVTGNSSAEFQHSKLGNQSKGFEVEFILEEHQCKEASKSKLYLKKALKPLFFIYSYFIFFNFTYDTDTDLETHL